VDSIRALAIAYVAALVAFLVLDALWLGTMYGRLYKPQLGALLRDAPQIAPAAAFYLLYIAALTVLVVAPALTAPAFMRVMALGALFGLAAYGTYNLTNYATLRGWSGLVTIADMIWGGVASGLAACVGLWAARTFG
jgi:uncharacterized membrane protein